MGGKKKVLGPTLDGSSGLFTPFVHLLNLFLSIFLKERLSKAFVLLQNSE